MGMQIDYTSMTQIHIIATSKVHHIIECIAEYTHNMPIDGSFFSYLYMYINLFMPYSLEGRYYHLDFLATLV